MGLVEFSTRKQKLDRDAIGGKAIGLFKLARYAHRLNYTVPSFFVVPTDFRGHEKTILDLLRPHADYAIRSSSPLEDSQAASFAGVFDSYTNVRRKDVIDAIRLVRASAVNEKATAYAAQHGIKLTDRMAVIVQRMAPTDVGGVIFTTNPSYPIASTVSFSSDGPRAVVEGRSHGVETHEFDKTTLRERQPTELFRSEESIYSSSEGAEEFKRWQGEEGYPLNRVARLAEKLERTFKTPLDVEFTWNHGKPSHIHLLQARPITDVQTITPPTLREPSPDVLVLRAKTVRGIGTYEGPVVINAYDSSAMFGHSGVASNLAEDDELYPNGYVLMTPHFNNSLIDYDELTPNKRAIVEYSGSSLGSHSMTVARERGILYLGYGRWYDLHHDDSIERRILSMLHNGDIVRVESDGRNGHLVKIG